MNWSDFALGFGAGALFVWVLVVEIFARNGILPRFRRPARHGAVPAAPFVDGNEVDTDSHPHIDTLIEQQLEREFPGAPASPATTQTGPTCAWPACDCMTPADCERREAQPSEGREKR